MVDVDEEGRIFRERDAYLQVFVADHCVMVIIQFLKRAWPCFCECLENMPDLDPRRIESGQGILFPLPPGAIERVRRVGKYGGCDLQQRECREKQILLL